MFTCRICGSTGHHTTYTIPDMLYGTGERFRYVQCGACTCLQIGTIPGDRGPYYRGAYYSLSVSPERKYSDPLIAVPQAAGPEHRPRCGPLQRLARWVAPNRKLLPLAKAHLIRKNRRSQVRAWKKMAARLNRERRGDQAAFLLKKPASSDEHR